MNDLQSPVKSAKLTIFRTSCYTRVTNKTSPCFSFNGLFLERSPVFAFFVFFLSFVSLAGCAHSPPQEPLQVVEDVDLQRYLGTWYEIASYPHPFQENCVGTKATYSTRDDGRIGVLNECREHTLDGAGSPCRGGGLACRRRPKPCQT